MDKSTLSFDWSDLAFSSKKPISSLKATFIAAPREISSNRFKQLIKDYLPHGNIVLGLAKEPFIQGFEGQPQFRTLQVTEIQKIIDKVNLASPAHKIYCLYYFQREVDYILQKIRFAKVLFINGSWQYTFHTSSTYYTLVNRAQTFELVSVFCDQKEARNYDLKILSEITSTTPLPRRNSSLNESQMLKTACDAAKYSYDYNFQTGTALGLPTTKRGIYKFVAATHNKVVPYQTYAMLNGASREISFSPPHDLNHYDTVHAEVMMLLIAQQQALSLLGTTLFVNLLPCPPCSRMLSETGVSEIIYSADHSEGYAIKILQQAGKVVRRLI